MDTLPSPVLDRVYRGHDGPVRAVKFNPNMQQIVSCGGNAVFVWHFKKQLRPHQFEGHKAEVTDVCVSQDGSLIASSSCDKTIRLWKNASRGDSSQIKGHTGPVRSVCFSNDDGQLLTSSDDKIIKIWSTESRKFLSSLDGHTNWVRCARFAPDRTSMVASCGDDKTVKVWDTRERKCSMSFTEHVDAVNKVLFHPDGSCIAACSDDNSINLWDIRAKRLLQHYDAHAGPVSEICFDDGGGLLSTSFDQTIKMWDLREGNLVYTTQGHDGPVFSCAFSPKKGYFVTGGQDCMVHIWKSGFPSPENISGAALVVNASSPRKDPSHQSCRPPTIRDFVPSCAQRPTPKTNNNVSDIGPAPPLHRPITPTENVKEKADSVSPLAGRKPLLKKQENENVPVHPTKAKEIVGVENAELQKTLQEISAQMSILVKTVKLLEGRMRLQEQQIDTMATAMQKQNRVIAQEATETAETTPA
eukprot:GEMP01021041.1.p1 GENE.GEMP01021041.1~~GEMP01021041.1.p1  ORF type:complete len:472 (+),score=88.44 GEMP01021041.1:72-1487(+)